MAGTAQDGRYQEFVQCDADIIGSTGVFCELELVSLFHEALTALGVPQFRILVNDRRILAGMAAALGAEDRLTEWTVAVDKQDKVGVDGVRKELAERGFEQQVKKAPEPCSPTAWMVRRAWTPSEQSSPTPMSRRGFRR